jgi:hypothetical protein
MKKIVFLILIFAYCVSYAKINKNFNTAIEYGIVSDKKDIATQFVYQLENNSSIQQKPQNGTKAKTNGTKAKTNGTKAKGNGNDAKATGNEAKANGNDAKATGNEAKANGNDAKATGNKVKTNGNDAKATGNKVKTNGNDAKATGNKVKAKKNKANANGKDAKATENKAAQKDTIENQYQNNTNEVRRQSSDTAELKILGQKVTQLEKQIDKQQSQSADNKDNRYKIDKIYYGLPYLISIIVIGILFIYLFKKKNRKNTTENSIDIDKVKEIVNKALLESNKEYDKRFSDLEKNIQNPKDVIKSQKDESNSYIKNNVNNIKKEEQTSKILPNKKMYASWSQKFKLLCSQNEIGNSMQFELIQIKNNEVHFRLIDGKIISRKQDFDDEVCEIEGSDDKKGFETIQEGIAQSTDDSSRWKVIQKTIIKYK